LSIPFAAIYSGPALAAASLARAMLFALCVYVFLYEAFGPGRNDLSQSMRRFRLVYWAAVVSAAFACADFYFQFPAPAGFGPQFVWLDSGVYRRAQGVFYEASTLGNLCAFFLIVIATALAHRSKREKPLSFAALAAGLAAFASALVLSFSRASLVNLILAITALLFLQRRRIASFRLAALPCVAIGGGAVISYIAFPQVAEFYWQRVSASAAYFFSATEGVLSGRVESWRLLGNFLLEHPWHALFGVGYKTLPYSDFVGRPVITDNAYLSALVETGIVGLVALLLLCAAVLRLAFRAARHSDPRVAFFGTCIFCFWAGEMAQMMSGDLLTYWRVLPVYMWVLGIAVRHSVDEHPATRSVQ
jgi:O-antigen ligase